MDVFYFNPDSPDQATFSSSCVSHELDTGPYKIIGSCSKDEDGTIRVKWQRVYDDSKGTEYYTGRLDEQDSIVGYKSWSEDVSEEKFEDYFIYRRVRHEIMQCRPGPTELKDNKYRALWAFAIKVTIQDVRKRMWSWSYFAERRRIRKRYIKLNINYWTYGRSLTPDETVEYLECRKSLSAAESLFYRSLRERLLVTIPAHQ